MPEWLAERGIGEQRLALVDRGEIVEARILVDGILPAGTTLSARLADPGANGRNAIAVADGQEYLLPTAPPRGVAQGQTIEIEITRERIPGSEPWKRAQARLADPELRAVGHLPEARSLPFPAPRDELAEAGWDELVEEARSGTVRFAGGELRVSATPAMTLIDIDGRAGALELAVAGAAAAARTVRRHGIGGSIGIDFPTVAGKAGRQSVAAAIDAILPQPFERTAVNGFGFLQIVRPRRHASLFELAADPAPFEARALLRRLARSHGRTRIVAHPAVVAVLDAKPEWLAGLGLQIGGQVGLRANAALPMSGGYGEPF